MMTSRPTKYGFPPARNISSTRSLQANGCKIKEIKKEIASKRINPAVETVERLEEGKVFLSYISEDRIEWYTSGETGIK